MNKYLSLFFGLVFLASCKEKRDAIPAPTPQAPSYTVPATSDIVLYEVNERAYSSTGNFAGVTLRLDSIKALGVNVIWLMPINPIGIVKTVNSPYCVRDFLSVNSEYGTLDDLKTLVNTAHSKGMSVILDWAANQTSWDHLWITEHKNWYVQDASGNIQTPNSIFLDVAQLDYTNMDMRAEMISNMKYWITTASFDGFRCDFADNVTDSFWQQAIDSLNNMQPSKPLILLAEGYNTGHLVAGFQMNFGEGFYSALVGDFKTSSPGIPSDIYTANTNEYNGVPAGKQRLRFTTTHDHSAFDGTPMVNYGGKQGSLAAAVVTFYMAGVPLIYGSQEVGTTGAVSFFNMSTPIDWSANPDMVAEYKKIIALRKASPALKTGALTSYADNNIVCYTRTSGTDTYLILVNVRNSGIVFSVPAALQGSWSDAFSGSSTNLGATQNLNAYQYIVLKK
jgi:glycosidase